MGEITSTTSVPPFWIRFVRYSTSLLLNENGGLVWFHKYTIQHTCTVNQSIMHQWTIWLYIAKQEYTEYTCQCDDLTCDKSGRMVMPACPPTTGTFTSLGSTPITSACTTLEFTNLQNDVSRCSDQEICKDIQSEPCVMNTQPTWVNSTKKGSSKTPETSQKCQGLDADKCMDHVTNLWLVQYHTCQKEIVQIQNL